MTVWNLLGGVLVLTLASGVGGCGANYSWRSSVPADMRTVTVPTFRNESIVMELGAVASRQLLREFQREGTFKIRSADAAALEIQGVVKSATPVLDGYDRRSGARIMTYEFSAKVEVSVIDRRRGKVLVNNRLYEPRTVFTAGQDRTTAMRDASGRLMDDLSRQVVDDILNLKW